MFDNVSEWPVEKTNNVDLSDLSIKGFCSIHIERFSKMNILLCITARNLNIMRAHSFKAACLVPTAKDLCETDFFYS